MHVTDIKIRRSFTEGNDIKLIKGREKFIIAMPSRVGMDGTHRDIVHPIKAELRSEIETRIIQFYENL